MELAQKIKKSWSQIRLKSKNKKKIDNPRVEKKKHYYNPINKEFNKIGLKPTKLNENFIISSLKYLTKHKDKINKNVFLSKSKNGKIKNEIISTDSARGSSKSIKLKNLVKIKNISLLERNFRAIKNSKITKYIYCSTESRKIADACLKIGLKVIKRPISLSKDNSNIFYVAKHALDI